MLLLLSRNLVITGETKGKKQMQAIIKERRILPSPSLPHRKNEDTQENIVLFIVTPYGRSARASTCASGRQMASNADPEIRVKGETERTTCATVVDLHVSKGQEITHEVLVLESVPYPKDGNAGTTCV